MIACPNCGHEQSRVRDSVDKEKTVVRYRICKHCHKSFVTHEYLAVNAGPARGMVIDRPPEAGGDG